MRRAPSSIATAPISTRSSARCARATSASTRCTSTSTRPSRRPHGGGGPGSGPVVLSEALAPYAPLPFVAKMPDGSFKLVEEENARRGASRAPSAGWSPSTARWACSPARSPTSSATAPTACKQVAEDAVLNANYILRSLEDVLDAPFAQSGPCMHEAIFSDQRLRRRHHHARSRQGADRRGLPPDDHVFPAGRPRRDAGRADRDRIEGEPRPVHLARALDRRAGQGRRPEPQGRAGLRAAPPARRDAWRRASRC